MSIRERLNQLKAEGRKALIPYIMAGDPDLNATEIFLKTLAVSGADLIELGVPYSDPMADGAVNQRASERALKNGTGISEILQLVKKVRAEKVKIPIIIFTYFNPIYAYGVERFAQQAQQSGVDGVLVVDLPIEESQEYRKILAQYQLETVFLASPTTSEFRLKQIDQTATGCVYYVARTGVTGVRAELSQNLEQELSLARKQIAQPLIVGFGISTPEQAKRVAENADGIVVGSAMVQRIEQSSHVSEAVIQLKEFCMSLKKGF